MKNFFFNWFFFIPLRLEFWGKKDIKKPMAFLRFRIFCVNNLKLHEKLRFWIISNYTSFLVWEFSSIHAVGIIIIHAIKLIILSSHYSLSLSLKPSIIFLSIRCLEFVQAWFENFHGNSGMSWNFGIFANHLKYTQVWIKKLWYVFPFGLTFDLHSHALSLTSTFACVEPHFALNKKCISVCACIGF